MNRSTWQWLLAGVVGGATVVVFTTLAVRDFGTQPDVRPVHKSPMHGSVRQVGDLFPRGR